MRNPNLITILAFICVAPLYAQETAPAPELESYCYDKPLTEGTEAGVTRLNAVVFRPPADRPAP